MTPSAIRPALFAPPGVAEQTSKFPGESSSKRRYWIPVVVAIALLLVSLVVWLTWREPVAEIAASEMPSRLASAPAAPSDHPALRVLPLKPNPGVASRQSDRLRAKDVLRNAAEIEPATGGPHSSVPAAGSATGISEANHADEATWRSATSSSTSEPPPSVEMTTSTARNELISLSSAPAALPAFGARVSTGVTDASLIRKVEPTYPTEARSQRLVGTVILDATISEDGSINEMKVISGPPLLAAAAITAVRQWRYTPPLLNGKPISLQKRITIIFKRP